MKIPNKKKKKESTKRVITESPEGKLITEINKTLEYLGRRHSEGAVKGDNLVRILSYLIKQKSEAYDKTVSRLSLRIGIMNRYVKENYLYGLEAEGLLNVYVNSNVKVWEWIGVQ